jgi:hypothetical protein
MKKYMVFFIDDMFCPSGGMNDFEFDTNELAEAKEKITKYLKSNQDRCAHIYDIYERKIIFEQTS